MTTSLVSAACVTDSAAAALFTPEALAEARHALHTTSWPWPHHWTEFDVADHLRAFRAEGCPV